jgi:hypothetical protein
MTSRFCAAVGLVEPAISLPVSRLEVRMVPGLAFRHVAHSVRRRCDLRRHAGRSC